MKLLKLYINNFLCYSHGYIDFTQFSSALIIGKVEHNDVVSNGVGKTTIFRAIEYALFNHSDANLEKIIRDDADSCAVVVDFLIGDQEYRISRKRTKKGVTDLLLLQRNAQPGTDEEIYHSIIEKADDSIYEPHLDKDKTEKYWKNISGSRAGDTEKTLAKLIKINAKSFRSTIHFMQNDFAGLPTATPEKRKLILKEALNLAIYSKLEKIAKDKASSVAKDIDKNKTVLETLGTPENDLKSLNTNLDEVSNSLNKKTQDVECLVAELDVQNTKITNMLNDVSSSEEKSQSLLDKEKNLSLEKNRLEISVKEYQTKKSNVNKLAKEIINEINSLKESQLKLAGLDFSQIDILNEQISSLKEQITVHNVSIKQNMDEYEDLKIPLPSGSICKNCRKPMTDADRKEHKAHISKTMTLCQDNIKKSKADIALISTEIKTYQASIDSLTLSKQKLEEINTKITNKNNEFSDKKVLFEEYSELLIKFQQELELKKNEIDEVSKEIDKSSVESVKTIKAKIELEKQIATELSKKIAEFNKEIAHLNNNKAVLLHSIDQKNKDKNKFLELKKAINELEKKQDVYQPVLQSFSSTGIPNLIIQNVLDDLQVEANNLLAQLKPGLQLSFLVEKTVEKTGDQADTLDISYKINGRDRYYELLSGAQKLAVIFSLKLGLSFLIQKMIGTNIEFLLLDEVDQSLDKSSVDAFADIVKFFQKDFTILVITHNDRLKDKFSHAILVEQDANMVSKAKVVSSW